MIRWWRQALFPGAAGARSVTEKLGIRYVCASYQPFTLPSPHHPPHPRPGRPLPPAISREEPAVSA